MNWQSFYDAERYRKRVRHTPSGTVGIAYVYRYHKPRYVLVLEDGTEYDVHFSECERERDDDAKD